MSAASAQQTADLARDNAALRRQVEELRREIARLKLVAGPAPLIEVAPGEWR